MHFTINKNYTKLQGSYLFAAIGKKIARFQEENPDVEIIRLGIGDVTQPIAPAILTAMHKAVDEMGHAETFRGYAPEQGYEFLRDVIAEKDFRERGCDISADEIFISDGAKCDSGNLQEILGPGNTIAVCDPVYPVYVDANVMAGRTGSFDMATGKFGGVVYMPCLEGNGFLPELPAERADIIYLCFPNNPTGEAITKAELQKWVDHANQNGSLIIFDAAYEAYIREEGIPHSIYECEGARTCAIEMRSFSKKAGFTGVRLGFSVIPKELRADGESLNALWLRRQGTKYNGTPYIVQRAGEAVYSEEGSVQVAAQIDRYMENASLIRNGLIDAGYQAFGGVNSPYIWMKTPHGMPSWEFFDFLLTHAGVVGTPGAGFGPSGEGYFRLTAFGTYENSIKALEKIRKI